MDKNIEKYGVEFEFDKIVEIIKDMENIIKNVYQFDNFVLTCSIENSYNNNIPFVRISLTNDLRHKENNNGSITLVHKIFNFDEQTLNEIILKFFSIQTDLKDFKFTYKLKDNRKND